MASSTPKAIGRELFHGDVGDEIVILLEDGTYMNREITDFGTDEGDGPPRVQIGDPTEPHLVVELDESDDELEVPAYTLTDDPDDPLDYVADVKRAANLADTYLPEMTFEEALEENGENVKDREEAREEIDEIKRMSRALDRASDHIDAAYEGEITMAEMERRIAALEVQYGNLAI